MESEKESEGQSGESILDENAGGQERRAETRAEKREPVASKVFGVNQIDKPTSELPFTSQPTVDEFCINISNSVAAYQRKKTVEKQREVQNTTRLDCLGEETRGNWQIVSPTLEAEIAVERLIRKSLEDSGERARVFEQIKEGVTEVRDSLREAETRIQVLQQNTAETNEENNTQGVRQETNRGWIESTGRSGPKSQRYPENSAAERKTREEEESHYNKEKESEPRRQSQRTGDERATWNDAFGLQETASNEITPSFRGKTAESAESGSQARDTSIPTDTGQIQKTVGHRERKITTVTEIEATTKRADNNKETRGSAPSTQGRRSPALGTGATTEGGNHIQRKIVKERGKLGGILLDSGDRFLGEVAGRIDSWVQRHRDQSVDKKVDDVSPIGLSETPTGSSQASSSGNRRELNPLEIQEVTKGLKHLSVGSSESQGSLWPDHRVNMSTRLPHFRIPIFHGNEGENYIRFFDEMEGLARISGWSQNEHLQIVKLGLKDGAATWLKAKPDQDQDSVEKVKAIIKEAFGDKRPNWQKHRDLSNLQQEKGQSVRAFALKIKEYANPEDQNDAHLLAVFIAGVPRHISIELAKSELTTLDQAVAQAVRIESVDKRSADRKAGLMNMEVEGASQGAYRNQDKVQVREFDNMMENLFMEYPNSGNGFTAYQGGYSQGNYNRGGFRGGRGRYANQGNYNNRAQGGTPPGGPLTAEEYKQRSLMRAKEYKRQMRVYLGQQEPDNAGGKVEGTGVTRYCIIHDSKTHATADCLLLRDDPPGGQGPSEAGMANTKQVTFAPPNLNQGN